MFNVFCCFIIKLLLLFAVVSTCSSVISLHLLWFIHMTPCKTMWVSCNISTNSPAWFPYISFKKYLREFDERSKNFPCSDYFNNSHSLFS